MSKSALAITEEHTDLADAAFGQLNRLNSRAAARATLEDGSSHPAEIWSAAADLGWTGLAIAEEHGGSGFGLAELAVVLEAQGHELCPGPFLPSVAAAVVIDRCAPDSVRAELLPGLADGSTVGALAVSGSVTVGSDLVVTGESPAVLGAPDADLLVVVAGDDVVVVDASQKDSAEGVTITALTSLDTTRSVGSVALRGVTIAEDRVLRGAARKARTVFRILASAEAVGVSWATLEMAVEYAKVREQFGRTIGTFQAVKHHAANMLVNAEETTAATWDAARADDLDSAWFAAAVAASHAIRTQIFNSQNNIQLHGGIGFTWEHDAHLYLRRARTLAALMAGKRRSRCSTSWRVSAAARRTAPRSPCPPRPSSTGTRPARPSPHFAACPPTSSVTSSSTPATWCRTGPSRGAAPRTCSSSWSSRRSSVGGRSERPGNQNRSSGPTWGSPDG